MGEMLERVLCVKLTEWQQQQKVRICFTILVSIAKSDKCDSLVLGKEGEMRSPHHHRRRSSSSSFSSEKCNEVDAPLHATVMYVECGFIR